MTEIKNQTLALIKPDAVKRGLVGKIITRVEDIGFNIRYMSRMYLHTELAERFYGAQHAGQPYFRQLIDFMTSGPIFTLLIETPGEGALYAVTTWRQMMGSAHPDQRESGTIRFDFCVPGDPLTHNLVHGSDSHSSLLHEARVMGLEYLF